MRAPLLAVLAASLALPGVAEAQLSRRSIALETGISREIGSAGGARAGLALRATAWLEGPAEATARLALGSARETGGRVTATVCGTLGVRLSRGTGPLRPQLLAEVGWARVPGGGTSRDRPAWGIAAGLEWFPALDLSVALGAGVRGAGGDASTDLTASVSAYF